MLERDLRGGNFDHLRGKMRKAAVGVSCDIQQFKKELVAGLIVLLLEHLVDLVALVLVFKFKSVQPAELVLLPNQVC
jgi:hypothetical protein